MAIHRVTIPSSTRGVDLAGTLEQPGEFNAVALLLPGSGPQDRDGTIFGRKPLRCLARALCRRGVASLRCDDRGVGGSGGSYLSIDGDVLLADARRQLAWLGDRFPGARLATVGHSQGALLALRLAAAASSPVARVVLLGAALRPGMEFMMEVRARIAEDAGLAGEDRASFLGQSRRLFEAIVTIEDADARAAAVRDLVRRGVEHASDADMAPEFGTVDQYVEYAVSDAMEWEVRELLRSDPASDLARVRSPVLALWGEHDRHVNPRLERAAFDSVASRTGVSMVLQGMNHLFQRSINGRLDRYAIDGAPMRRPVPRLVADWTGGDSLRTSARGEPCPSG